MFKAELEFMKSAFSKCNLQFTLIDFENAQNYCFDLGLREMLGCESAYERKFFEDFLSARERTIYRITDTFLCSYLYFLLPDQEKPVIVVLGPYLAVELTYEQLLEHAEALNFSPEQFKLLEKFYGSLPILKSDNSLFVLLDSFAELIWGGGSSFTMVDINYDSTPDPHSFFVREPNSDSDEIPWDLASLEKRYSHENELMQAVSLGQTHKAELLMSGFSKLSFERRLADPVRNIKNYCIIMNTLMRKAAESGGVHPLYLDRMSSGFAKDIEMITSTDAAQVTMDKMLHSYCRLVRKHATQHYSPPVQKTILYINTNLGSDLSLNALSNEQRMNASYLSALFKKETGTTVTEYVNQKRVQRACDLLKSTKLQIQTIAQHCGISDVNYFSKIFKKYTGKAPKEYRKEVQHQGHPI